ncbi:MAG: CRISPR-associated helicase Cas3' [Ignisphaera sp.]
MFLSGKNLLDTVSNYIEKLDKLDRVVVIEAPTGYGKSVGAPIVGALNYLKGFSHNFIHILPLRAIVEDLYICKYMAALRGFQEVSDICRAPPPKIFSDALRSMGVKADDVAYQMGLDYMIRDTGVKEPTYDAKVVVSTLDSFAYNFLRMPVTEFFRDIKHYATPRARIFTATIFLDEVHMLKRFDDESSEKALAFLKVLLEYSLKTFTPVIMATATLWNRFREAIRSWCNNKVVFFALSNKDEKTGSAIYVRDRSFEDSAKSINWSTGVVDEVALASKIDEHVGRGERVLVVRDTIDSAVETFNRVDIDKKVLIHSRLCLGDREEAFKKAREAKVVVATPVVEAGVDWDFDAGFRDATNIPSAVQVFGRVCRNRENCDAHVYLIKTRESIGDVIEYVNSYRYIDWRIPYNYTRDGVEWKGYGELLELSKIGLDVNSKAEETFRALIAPIALPSTYISMVQDMQSYSILKEPLIQLYVYGFSGLDNAKTVSDVILGTLTHTLRFVQKHANCVEGFACVVDGPGIEVEKLRIESRHLDPQSYIRLYKSCLERIYSHRRGRPVFSGLVLRRECYRDGLGLCVGG